MKRNLLIILNIFLFIIFIAEVILITTNFPSNKPKEAIVEEAKPIETATFPSPTSIVDSLNTPPLPSSLDWQIADKSDQNSLYYTNKNDAIYQDGAEFTVDGEEWVSIEESESQEIDDYQNTLEAAGWGNGIEYNGHRYMSAAADGPTGGVWGYLKIVDDKIRVVIVSLRTISKTSSKTTYPCPCNYEYRIFVSEPISLEGSQNAVKLKPQVKQ